MTDLKNGKLDLFGFEITPSTTMEEFERVLGNKFKKKALDKDNVVSQKYWFLLNDDVGVSSVPFDPAVHTIFELNGMSFIQIMLIFKQDTLSELRLITDMNNYVVDTNGKSVWSDSQVKNRFNKMNSWAKTLLGQPNIDDKYGVVWNYTWGAISPSSISDAYNSSLYIEYGRKYV